MRNLLLVLLLCLPAFAIPRIVRDTTALPWAPQPMFLVPLGTMNVALGKTVTTSDEKPRSGNPNLITDGSKENWGAKGEVNWLELAPGRQWVQIDLMGPCRIFGVQMWHYYSETTVFRDVVVQLSNDPDFVEGVRTIFNNDQNNTSGFGIGKDREFYEHSQGYRIERPGKNYEGVVARYVRLYSNGNSSDATNRYLEVEVIGKPLAPQSAPGKAPRQRANLTNWVFSPRPAFYSQWNGATPDPKLPPAPSLPKEFWVPRGTCQLTDVGIGKYYYGVSFSAQPPWKPDYYYYPTRPWHRLAGGLQWMQITMPPGAKIHGIRVWHWQHVDVHVFQDVIVQAADDAKFTRNVRTLWNNDLDNSAKRGKGRDREYSESPNGLLIDTRGKDFRGLSAPYLRFYSRGAKRADATHYIMTELIGEFAELKGPPRKLPKTPPGFMWWQTSDGGPMFT